MRSLFKSVVLITFFSVLTRLSGFLFRVYLSREIGAEALGIYQIAFSVFIVLLTIVSSGLPFIISRMVAKIDVKKDRKIKSGLVSSSVILAVTISVSLCLIILAFKNIFANVFTDRACIEVLIALLPAIIFSAVYSVFRGALWGENNYFALCVSEFYEQILRIFVCVLFLGGTLSVIDSALSVAWSLSIACAFSAVFVLLLYFYYGGGIGRPNRVYKKVLKQSAPITFVRVAGSLIQPIVAIIIPLRLVALGYTADQALSLYGVALGMSFPLLFVPGMLIGSLSTALVPDISSALSKGQESHIEGRIKTSINFTLFISCLFVPLYLGVGDIIGNFLYNNTLSGSLIQFAAWIMIPMGLTSITSSILNSLGMEIRSCVNYFLGAISLFVSIWFLPEFFGINAFAVGMGICSTITSILNVIMLKKKTKIKMKVLRPIALFCLTIIPSAAITSFLGAILSYFLPDFFTLLISCAVGGGFFIGFSIVLGVINLNIFNVFKEKFKLKRQKRIHNNA